MQQNLKDITCVISCPIWFVLHIYSYKYIYLYHLFIFSLMYIFIDLYLLLVSSLLHSIESFYQIARLIRS
jgi:hypothetical protein